MAFLVTVLSYFLGLNILKQLLKSVEWGCSLDNGPKLAVVQPNNNIFFKKKESFFFNLSQRNLVRIKKSCKNIILRKVLFCPKMGKRQNRPKIVFFSCCCCCCSLFFFVFFLCIFCIFWKILVNFPRNNLKWKISCYLYFTTNPLSGKIQILKLWTKMVSNNQIAGFFKA